MGNRDVTKQIRVKQWAQIIQDRCASGLYVDEYCEQHGISRNQYYYWLREVKEAAINECMPRLVEVTPEPELPAPAEKALANHTDINFKPEMTINVGGISLGIDSNTPSELIRKTLEALNYAK